MVGDRIDVTVHVDPSDHDRLTGLPGDADGGPTDDLALANGTTLSRPPSFDALYGPFRASWLVNESTSPFDYENGTGPSTYDDADVPAESVTLADFDDADVEEARQKALDAGLGRQRHAALDARHLSDARRVVLHRAGQRHPGPAVLGARHTPFRGRGDAADRVGDVQLHREWAGKRDGGRTDVHRRGPTRRASPA